MSVETPCKFISIQVGALIWYSTICARPRRLSAFTLTVELPTPTSMRSRLECVACTRTAFWFQAHHDLAAEVVDVEPHAWPDGHGRIGLLGHNQRDDGRDVQEHDVFPPKSWPARACWRAAAAPACAAWCRRGVDSDRRCRDRPRAPVAPARSRSRSSPGSG